MYEHKHLTRKQYHILAFILFMDRVV